MNHNLGTNAPMVERLKFSPSSVTTEEITDLLTKYEALVDAVNRSDLDILIGVEDTPEEIASECNKALKNAISNTIESCRDNPYKDFFDDCVSRLAGFWPGESIDDQNLRSVILDAIARGEDAS